MMKTELAPICLFTYNRFKETKETVEALRQNYLAPHSLLYVFSDGAKNSYDEERINKVRNYIETVDGFKKVTIFKSDKNKGLARSIISGVSQVISKYEKVIVLEDDLITAPNFLNFMNQALNCYKSNKDVFSVSGYSFDLKSLNDYDKDFYVGYRASSWGWGTWLDRWEEIDWEILDYNKFRRNFLLRIKFMRGGSDLPRMLRKQMSGKIDSWAIRWVYNQFKKETYTIFPKISKIENIGFADSATHTKRGDNFTALIDNGIKQEFEFNNNLDINKTLLKEFKKRFSVLNRLKVKLKILIKLKK